MSGQSSITDFDAEQAQRSKVLDAGSDVLNSSLRDVERRTDLGNGSPYAHDLGESESRETLERPASVCQSCGGHVTEQFRRVFGNDDDVIYSCLDCATMRELHAGLGADPGADNQFSYGGRYR